MRRKSDDCTSKQPELSCDMYEPISTISTSNIRFSDKRHRCGLLLLLLAIETRQSTSFSRHHHRVHSQEAVLRPFHAALLPNVNRFVIASRGPVSQPRGLPNMLRYTNQFQTSHRGRSALKFSWSSTVIPLAETAFSAAPTSIRAGIGMIVSTIVGHWIETRMFSGSGILATLGTAAILTNLRLAPSQHYFYDWSWSMFLPASLVLLLLSLQNPASSISKGDTDVDASLTINEHMNASPSAQSPSAAMTSIGRLALPFLLATIGSVLGCLGSSSLSSRMATSPTTKWFLHREEACFAAACLAASFVGGSVNFFATSAAILNDESSTQSMMINENFSKTNLVTSMAAADLVVMAVYFASLGAMANSRALRTWFGYEVRAASTQRQRIDDSAPSTGTTGSSPEFHSELITVKAAGGTDFTVNIKNVLQSTVAASIAITFAFMVVSAARQVEQLLLPIVPGTACAFIAVAVPLAHRIWCQLWGARPAPSYFRSVRTVSALLSQWCFLLLFASIGMSADLTMALRDGPACLLFSLSSLLLHVIFLLGTSRWWVHFRTKLLMTPSSLPSSWTTNPICVEEVLIASNAAIGGPATAAAFCGQLASTPSNPDDNERKAAWTVAATFYGVVGYAIGTTIGVSLHRLLASTRGLL